LNLWQHLENKDIWKQWSSTDPIAGITSHAGFIDNSPLYNLIMGIYKQYGQVKKHTYVSANDAITGAYIPYALHELDSDEQIVSAVVGSASMPFVFPPMDMSKFGQNYLLIDGGSTWNNNMISAIKDCKSRPGITKDS
jgi:predicted acylesterase/phospholipase RssA